MVASLEVHVLIVGLLVGYAAGVAAGIAFRPWISVTAMLLAVLPTIVVSFTTSDPIFWGVGALLSIFLVGGVQSILAHYRRASTGITMKRLFADMARSDVLTGLPNRFELGERFNQVTSLGRENGDIAVHCLDLDRFKPVNDRHGHPVGDSLLQAVSERLARTVPGSDFVARIGGDEFVVVQSGISDATEAQFLARRIVKVISEPYTIGDLTITIGTSIGFALVSQHGAMLDKLIGAADQALLRAKAAGGGCADIDYAHRLAG
jgi:diguanylate cyclase (GGDEF)-like protein